MFISCSVERRSVGGHLGIEPRGCCLCCSARDGIEWGRFATSGRQKRGVVVIVLCGDALAVVRRRHRARRDCCEGAGGGVYITPMARRVSCFVPNEILLPGAKRGPTILRKYKKKNTNMLNENTETGVH